MRVTRSQLRKIILQEVITIVEGSDAANQRWKVKVTGDQFEFVYTELGNKISVISATKDGEPTKSGVFYDSHPLRTAKTTFRNKFKGKDIVFEF
tara:strand:+ start:95 stop:376 length:282 start_codon:yes stop_codon:yes gene_type:complete